MVGAFVENETPVCGRQRDPGRVMRSAKTPESTKNESPYGAAEMMAFALGLSVRGNV